PIRGTDLQCPRGCASRTRSRTPRSSSSSTARSRASKPCSRALRPTSAAPAGRGVRHPSPGQSSPEALRLLEVERDQVAVAGAHGRAVFRRGAIVTGACLGEPEGALIEPGAAGRLHHLLLGCELTARIDADLDRGAALFAQA